MVQDLENDALAFVLEGFCYVAPLPKKLQNGVQNEVKSRSEFGKIRVFPVSKKWVKKE